MRHRCSSQLANETHGPVVLPLDEWMPPKMDVGDNTKSESREAIVMTLRNRGYSVRQISYLSNVPRTTVGDICKRHRDGLPEPIPFYVFTGGI